MSALTDQLTTKLALEVLVGNTTSAIEVVKLAQQIQSVCEDFLAHLDDPREANEDNYYQANQDDDVPDKGLDESRRWSARPPEEF